MDQLAITGHTIAQLVGALGIGVVTGLLSGILGIGGAPILVPAMIYVLGLGQKTAQGVSLAVVVPTAIAGAIAHYRLGNVQMRVTAWLVPAAVVGAVVGALLASVLDAGTLRRAFAVLLLLLSARMAWTSRQSASH
jgi:uncharacterized membrane protein YfcA